MKVNFNLKNGIVWMTATLPDGRFRYSTGIHLTDEVLRGGQFNPKTALDRSKVLRLIVLRDTALKLILEGCGSVRKLRTGLDLLIGRKQRAGTLLSEFAEEWIKEYKKTHPRGTYKSYQTLLVHLKNLPVKLSEVDYDYFQTLLIHFQTEKKKDGEGYSKNFTAKMIANFRRLLHEAGYKGLWKGDTSRFLAGSEEVWNIYLTKEELDRIYRADLSPALRNAADLFLMGCYTGLRYSDFNKIKIQGELIVVDTQKTHQRIVLPIHPVVRELLKRDLHPISNAKLNLYLKDIGRIAHLDDEVSRTRTISGKRVTQTFRKYELLCSHTARRTFATLLYLDRVPAEVIMKLTGHRSFRQFMNYLKIDQEDTARILQDHPFFQSRP